MMRSFDFTFDNTGFSQFNAPASCRAIQMREPAATMGYSVQGLGAGDTAMHKEPGEATQFPLFSTHPGYWIDANQPLAFFKADTGAVTFKVICEA